MARKVDMQGPVDYYKPCPQCGAKRGWFTWWNDGTQTNACGCGRVLECSRGGRIRVRK